MRTPRSISLPFSLSKQFLLLFFQSPLTEGSRLDSSRSARRSTLLTFRSRCFSESASRIAHRATRNRYNPRANAEGFTCHQCGRSYQLRHNLVKHLRFECGGQKHFTCYLCPARYTQNGKLRQHMLNAHNIFVPPRRTWIRSAHGWITITIITIIRGEKWKRKERLTDEDNSKGDNREISCSSCVTKFRFKEAINRRRMLAASLSYAVTFLPFGFSAPLFLHSRRGLEESIFFPDFPLRVFRIWYIRRGRLDSHQRRTEQTKKNRKAATGRWTNEVSHRRYPASIRPPYPYFPLPYVELNKELNKKILIYPDSRDFQIIDYRFRVYSRMATILEERDNTIFLRNFFALLKERKKKIVASFDFDFSIFPPFPLPLPSLPLLFSLLSRLSINFHRNRSFIIDCNNKQYWIES